MPTHECCSRILPGRSAGGAALPLLGTTGHRAAAETFRRPDSPPALPSLASPRLPAPGPRPAQHRPLAGRAELRGRAAAPRRREAGLAGSGAAQAGESQRGQRASCFRSSAGGTAAGGDPPPPPGGFTPHCGAGSPAKPGAEPAPPRGTQPHSAVVPVFS